MLTYGVILVTELQDEFAFEFAIAPGTVCHFCS
jgi:hypothetical protein